MSESEPILGNTTKFSSRRLGGRKNKVLFDEWYRAIRVYGIDLCEAVTGENEEIAWRYLQAAKACYQNRWKSDQLESSLHTRWLIKTTGLPF